MAKEENGDHKGLNKSCILVIAVAGVEKFAFKGVASNLVTYLTEVVKMSNSSAAKTVNSWCGASFLLPLLGAFLADSYLDRYSTMRVSSILYVAGLVALTSTAFVLEWTTKSSSGLPASSLSTCLFWSLFLISLGQGGYNPCLQAFGAEQLETDEELLHCNKDSDDQSSKRKSLFFKWSYFGICIGSLLGISLMSYFQDILGWGLGFGIPTFAMAISVAPFLCGSRFYTLKQPKSTAGEKHIKNLLQSIKAIASKLINHKNIELPSKLSEAIELELQAKPLCNNDSESIEKNPNNGTEPIEDTKSILRLMPIWTMLLVFAIILQQPSTFFTKQGMTMKRNIGKSFTIPPATLQSALNISIIILMFFYDKTIIPISRIIMRDKKGLTVMQRMGVGMFLSILAMGTAAIVETKRLEISRRTSKELEPAVPMSIFWLLPQYSLLGFSDVFTVIGMQEFFYTEVPSGKKTVGMALHLSVFGIGSFLSAILISFIEIVTSHGREKKHSWFADDMNDARLDSFYWLLALSSALSLFFFVVLCKQYNRRNASTYIEMRMSNEGFPRSSSETRG